MASNLVRFIGANRVAPQLQQQASLNLGEQVDVTVQAYEQVRQNVHQGYEEVRKAMSARTNAYMEKAIASGRPERAAQLEGLANTVVEGLGIYKDMERERNRADAEMAKALAEEQEEQRKLELERIKQERESILNRDTYMAQTAVQETLLQLDGRIRTNGREAGIATTRQDLERILTTFSHLPPETLGTIRNMFFSTLQQTEQAVTTEVFNQQAEERDAQEASRQSMIRLHLTTELTALTNPQTSVGQAQATVGSIMTKLRDMTPDLSPQQRVVLIQPILESIVDNYQIGEQERQAVLRTLNSVTGFYTQMEEYRNAGMTQNPTSAQALAAQTATALGVPQLADDWLTDIDLTNIAVDHQAKLEQLRQLNFDANNRALAAQAPQYLAAAATTLAWDWMNEATPGASIALRRVQDNPEEATEIERAAARQVEAWQGYTQRYDQLTREVNDQRQQQARVSLRANPAEVGSTTAYLDTAAGRFRRTSIVDENGVLFIAPTATEAEVQASIDRVRDAERELQQLHQRAAREGLDITNIGNRQYVEGMRNQLNAIESAATSAGVFSGAATGNPIAQPPATPFPNFNGGGSQQQQPTTPPVNPLARHNNMLTPIAASRQGQFTVTSEYGMRTSPTSGRRAFHAGIDIAPYHEHHNRSPMGALTMQGGEVIAVRDWAGYGRTVMVRTPSGQVEQFSHLRNAQVRVGQRIPAGAVVGIIGGRRGEPGAGSSTGLHLHFQVWKAGTEEFGNPSRDTIDPEEYMRGIQQVTARNPQNQQGAPPTMAQSTTNGAMPSPASMPAYGGAPQWISDLIGRNTPVMANTRTNVAVPIERVATPSQPAPTTQAPINRRAYGFGNPNRPQRNNPRANYGYDVIARDPEFAAAIANLGDHLNIPAQWIADVMAYESTTNFNPNVENGIGAIGLIQAIPETYRALGLTRSQMLGMTRAEYVRRVARPYLDEFRGRIETVEDLLASIFGGARLFNRPPAARRNATDGHIKFYRYCQVLGNTTGRRYRTSYDVATSATRPVHTTPQAGCPTCQSMQARFRVVHPHEAPV